MLRTQLRMNVCETLLPDVVVPELHQNNHRYVRELSGPTFGSRHKNGERLHRGPKTNKKKW